MRYIVKISLLRAMGGFILGVLVVFFRFGGVGGVMSHMSAALMKQTRSLRNVLRYLWPKQMNGIFV